MSFKQIISGLIIVIVAFIIIVKVVFPVSWGLTFGSDDGHGSKYKGITDAIEQKK
ncbi:hypothetical protein HYH43_07265 [Clostridium botulinum]|uniref:hypothetical protein n=1 Tax=Clostridium botulinum TaxID=1491 RepID=UPI001C9B8716|nr:hypothetical protein [Clostridium botulinum]MBY6789237.1 hypothetical protein [Clostridium botulinum]MBY6946586.1 hypothetical protein [Clostridium botulinum]MBY7020214.1 hypothetical protein [Clostridium botulinum]